MSEAPFQAAQSRSDLARVAILNGFGRTLGDGIIGLQALYVATKLGVVPNQPVAYRLPGLPTMIQAVHAAAEFVDVRTLPWDSATPNTRFAPAERFGRVIDIRDFAFDPDFRCSSMIDFFLRRLGVEPGLVPPSSRRNSWLAQYLRPSRPHLPNGYVLVCPRASTPLRDMPDAIHERILRRALTMGPVVTQGSVPRGLESDVVQVPPNTSFADLCGLVHYARWVISTDTAMVHLADGHCQVNRLRHKLGSMTLTFRASSYLRDRRLLLPGPKRFGPSPPIADSTEAITPWPEVAVDDAMC